MKKGTIVAVVLMSAGLVAGCSNDPQINAAAGGLTGAAIGSQIGSGSGRTAAMLAGGAGGMLIGANATNTAPRY